MVRSVFIQDLFAPDKGNLHLEITIGKKHTEDVYINVSRVPWYVETKVRSFLLSEASSMYAQRKNNYYYGASAVSPDILRVFDELEHRLIAARDFTDIGRFACWFQLHIIPALTTISPLSHSRFFVNYTEKLKQMNDIVNEIVINPEAYKLRFDYTSVEIPLSQ